MKRFYFLYLVCSLLPLALFAQERLLVHQTDGNITGVLLLETDSFTFSQDGNELFFHLPDQIPMHTLEK